MPKPVTDDKPSDDDVSSNAGQPPPIQNIPIPDPSEMTTRQLRSAMGSLEHLFEIQIRELRGQFEAFRSGHEEKHHSVVNAAIQHRKELSEASVAIVKAQVDAQFSAQQSQISDVQHECDTKFAASDLRYQQRYDAQSDALAAAFDAQQKATDAALAAAKEAVTTALASSEKAVTKAEQTTSKLIPRAEVEARFNDVSAACGASSSSVVARIDAVDATLHGIGKLSDRVEKIGEALIGLDRVTDAKFVTFRTLIDSQAEKVALALAASNKAVDSAFASSAAAITKAETFNEKRFDLLTKAIDELKSYRDASVGSSSGKDSLWGLVVGGIGLVATIVSVVVILIGTR